MKPPSLFSCLLGLALLVGINARAEGTYYHLPLRSLTITEGALPQPSQTSLNWQMIDAMRTYAVLDGEGEVYSGGGDFEPWRAREQNSPVPMIAIHVSQTNAVSGKLYLPKPEFDGMLLVKFKVEPTLAKAESKAEFLRVKDEHYGRMLDRNVPGAGWFRHQEREVAKVRGVRPEVTQRFVPGRRLRSGNVEDTYELFSGGRALSENLQLDRALTPSAAGEGTVELASLTGITVREMDWKPLLKDVKPKTDKLAAYVPFDQHAIFFASFEAMTKMIDEADSAGTPVLQWMEPRAEDANTRGRYQTQLCLELNDISRRLGPQVIASVAVTGSDPYLPTGSDLGLLFQSKSPDLLKTYLLARHAAAKQNRADVKAVQGEIEGIAYSGVVSPDRAVCSYLAVMDEVVYVCNSLYQMGALIKVAKGKTPALISQDEYLYFRHRFELNAKEEIAFVILTDATIRRWCGPQWRIGNSRRTRAAAAMAEVQAASMDALAKGAAKPGPLAADNSLPETGALQLTSSGVLSSTYGTLDFMTPIAEMPMAKVTAGEANAYRTWRDGYQSNWRQMFDPIALRFTATPGKLSAELIVMPLIFRTDYSQFIELTRGSQILPGAGDPHPESLFHLAMSMNPEATMLKSAGNFLGTVNPSLRANPLGWLGSSIALYADKDPFWEQAKGGRFMSTNYHRLPVGLHCEVKNPLGLTVFLAGLRGFIDQTAPRMTAWNNLDHQGRPYVKITPVASENGPMSDPSMRELAIYYAATPKSLLITLSESVLKRALDRQGSTNAASASAAVPARPWLGTNLCLQVDRGAIKAFSQLAGNSYQTAQQRLCWNNFPILNEWKHLYGAQDPVKLHERFWQTKLVCPAGGTYVWNEKWQTMECPLHGHPGEPKNGPDVPLPLANVIAGNMGLTFENQGLSAKIVLEREEKSR